MNAGRCPRASGVPRPCLGADESSRSAVGNTGAESLEGDGVDAERLYAADQYQAPPLGTRVWGEIHVNLGGNRKTAFGESSHRGVVFWRMRHSPGKSLVESLPDKGRF